MRQAPKTSLRTKDCCEFEVACDQGHLFWPLLRLSYLQLCNFKQSWNLFFSFAQWLSSESLPCGRRCAQNQRQVLLPVIMCRLVCVIDYVLTADCAPHCITHFVYIIPDPPTSSWEQVLHSWGKAFINVKWTSSGGSGWRNRFKGQNYHNVLRSPGLNLLASFLNKHWK